MIQYFPCLEIVVTSENCKTGNTVSRGKDWKIRGDHTGIYYYGDQDHKNGAAGIGVITICQSDNWARVEWSNGNRNSYRIGAQNSYDLFYAGNNKSPKA